jgi:3-dehydroquinate synthase
VVTDLNVSALFPATLLALADDMILHAIEPGESSKGLEEVERLAARLAEAGFTRRDVIVGVGGGVVTDLAGFVASIYMRGIRSIAVPTTLLAQVDASVGGKTAVNAAGARNLLGTFRQPSAVLLSSTVLRTLPKRELRSGFVESMKMGIANSAELDAEVRRAAPRISLGMMPENVDRLIESSVRAKLAVVAEDVRDHGARMSLNLGHTFGHALEGCMPEVFAHGEAVAFGIIAAAELASLLGLLGARRRDEIVDRLLPFTRPEALDLDREALLEAMRADKKRSTDAVRFILPRDEGGVEAVEADPEPVRDAVERALERVATFHLSP